MHIDHQRNDMNEINLLDCTLRDGGYINDGEFGHLMGFGKG